MRVPNDRKLANASKEIDLFLGGHDHIYYHERVPNGNLFIKSSSDFKALSLITIEFREQSPEERELTPQTPVTDKTVVSNQTYCYEVRRETTVSVMKFDITLDIKPDPEIAAFIAECYSTLDKELAQVVCHLDDDMDTSFTVVRSQEAGIGNFLADLMRKEHNADCALLNGGTIRADRLYKKGLMHRGDWNEIMPFKTTVALLEVTGEQLLHCLENGVSKLPALEGRFLQVSNISFSYDSTKPPFERVDKATAYVGDDLIDGQRTYKVAVPNFMAWGKDGYDCLLEAKKIVEHLLGPELKDIIMEFLGSPD